MGEFNLNWDWPTPSYKHVLSDYHFTESGLNVWLRNWPLIDVDGNQCPVLPNPTLLVRQLLDCVLQSSEGLNGDEILFIRKRLGLRAKALAERLKVSIQEVNRWERDKDAMPPRLQEQLRRMAREHLLNETDSITEAVQ